MKKSNRIKKNTDLYLVVSVLFYIYYLNNLTRKRTQRIKEDHTPSAPLAHPKTIGFDHDGVIHTTVYYSPEVVKFDGQTFTGEHGHPHKQKKIFTFHI